MVHFLNNEVTRVTRTKFFAQPGWHQDPPGPQTRGLYPTGIFAFTKVWKKLRKVLKLFQTRVQNVWNFRVFATFHRKAICYKFRVTQGFRRGGHMEAAPPTRCKRWTCRFQCNKVLRNCIQMHQRTPPSVNTAASFLCCQQQDHTPSILWCPPLLTVATPAFTLWLPAHP